MPVSRDLVRLAVGELSRVDGIWMDPHDLVEDVVLLAAVFDGEAEFLAACANTRRALEDLVAGRVQAACLRYDLEGWQSYHYQHSVAQGSKADCRIMFRRAEGRIEVKGFGHRHVPSDFYRRMRSVRDAAQGA